MTQTTRSKLRRMSSRGSHDCETIYRILDAGFWANVGFCKDGHPFVIPTLYGRKADKLLPTWFSRQSLALRTGSRASGLRVCNPCRWISAIAVRFPSVHELSIGGGIWDGTNH